MMSIILQEVIILCLKQEVWTEKLLVYRFGYVERGEKTMSMESFVRIVNALDVSANELLSDSLAHPDHDEDREVSNLLGNCGDIEKRTLLAMLRAQEAIIINAMNDRFSGLYTVDLPTK